ncbi:MAG: metallophosphoesterase [Caldilineaceae bacterium]|nr:metallophosphoesterase [Caldilineaceae bacterium]
MRIALLADIHGNLAALEAVMVELERLQPDYVVVDGDLINAAPFSAEVIDIVRAHDWVVVRGNHEFYYLNFGTTRAVEGSSDMSRWGQLHWLVERIRPDQGAYLGMLPDERVMFIPGTEPVAIAHGVPGRNRVGFYPEQDAESIAAELIGVDVQTFVSAHTHVQVDRHVSLARQNGSDLAAGSQTNHNSHRTGEQHWHVINPGSVGLPLNGDPSAQFAMLTSVPEAEVAGGWRATHYRVPYDRRPTLEAYATTGMAAAGGVITQLFYWELVTADAEIILFYQWARRQGYDPDHDMTATFQRYCRATGRDAYVRSRDPLYQKQVKA